MKRKFLIILDIYIGCIFRNIPENAKVVIDIIEPYFPKGNLERERGILNNRFDSFDQAGTFVADLMGVLKHFGCDPSSIKAKVTLNIASCTKNMYGNQIVEFLNILEKQYKYNYSHLRKFPMIK